MPAPVRNKACGSHTRLPLLNLMSRFHRIAGIGDPASWKRRVPALLLILCCMHCLPAGQPPANLFQSIQCLVVAPAGIADAPSSALRRHPDWRNCPGDRLDAGFSKSAHWWRLSAPRAAAAGGDPAILTFRWKTLSKVDLFVFARDDAGAPRLIERQTAGDDRPRSLWPLITGDYPAFSITPASDREYYVRVESRSIQRFPIELHSPRSFQQLFSTESMIIWIFAGVIFTVALLSALFSIGLGERVYLYYGLYTLALWMSLNSVYGNTFRVFWPESPWLAHTMIFLTQSVVLWTSILFFRGVCDLDIQSPRADRVARVFQYAAAILIPLTLFDIPRVFFSRLYTITYLFAIPTFILVMIRLVVVQKQRELMPFAVGWGLYYAMAILHLMYFLGIVPYHPVAVYGMVLMLPVETIVFGGGLFVRYRALLRESAEHEREKQIALRELERLHNPRRYANSRLRGLDTDQLLLRLNQLLEHERVYRDETLTLNELAGKLGIGTHQLSELLNARLNVNFRKLLTNHRLKDAADQLLAFPDRTVLEIGLLVGFNSKTAFNVAFKQNYGVSPTQYRAGSKRAAPR